MGIIDQVARRFGYVKAQAGMNVPSVLRAGINEFSPEVPDLSLAQNQVELYQRLSWVYIAITNVAKSAAGSRFDVKTRVGEKTNDIPNHPFELLLDRPNPLHSRFEFLMASFAYYALAGNCYWFLNRTRADVPPSELWIIPPYQMNPVPDGQSYIAGYDYDPLDGSRPIRLETWEVAHFKSYHPRSRFVGMSAIEALAVASAGDLAMQKWNTNFFSKEHAKPSGALAYAAAVQDPEWERIKRDVVDQTGGTERRLLMLRNAGEKGVSWIQFGVNQKDMEFLAGRSFNKEEIYAALAPGLSSMLAVNATEANALAGSATFNRLAVWPIHQAIGEKITNDILPAYGENLCGEFEDVRLSDRQMELNEQQAACKVMTYKEVREKFYELPPFGDERDNKVVDGPAKPGTMVPAPLKPFTTPDGQAPEESEDKEDEIKPKPDKEETPKPKQEAEGEADADDQREGLKADLERWQRKSIKAIKAGRAALVKFDSDMIPGTLSEAINGQLEAADCIEDARRVFTDALRWQAYP